MEIEPSSSGETGNSKSSKPKSTETKMSKRKLLIWGTLTMLSFGTLTVTCIVNHGFVIASVFILLFALICGAFSLELGLIHLAAKHSTAKKWWWVVFVPSVLLCASILWALLSDNPKPEPKPYLVMSLRVNDPNSLPLLLTNDFLSDDKTTEVVTNPSNHALSFKTVATSCLIVPIDAGQSNAVFYLNVENDSDVRVDDLVVIVGFPDSWKIGVDGTKWEPVKEHLTSPEWRVELTNIQTFGAHSPWPLAPTDSVNLPAVTNYDVAIFTEPTTIQAGILDIMIRSTGFQKLMAANLIFLRGDQSFRKPFVTRMVEEPNGVWRFLITPKEIYELEQ